MVCPTTGEQAFSADSDKGEITLYLGASTTSGPIREMGLDIVSPTVVQHDREWYAEPFHGIYDHEFVLYPYEGTWQDAHLPKVMRVLSLCDCCAPSPGPPMGITGWQAVSSMAASIMNVNTRFMIPPQSFLSSFPIAGRTARRSPPRCHRAAYKTCAARTCSRPVHRRGFPQDAPAGPSAVHASR